MVYGGGNRSKNVSQLPHCLIPFPSVRQEICMSDFSLPAIILPSLQQCFLKYACPTFPQHLPKFKWMSTALASILFSLLSPPASALLPATPMYLWLTQFPGFDPYCGVEADGSDRHKGTSTSWHGSVCGAHCCAHPPL